MSDNVTRLWTQTDLDAEARRQAAAKAAPRKITEGEADQLQLDSFVMHIKTHLCANCGSGEMFSDLFEVWAHPTKTGGRSALHVLRPATTLQRLPIAYIRLPIKMVPICSECVEALNIDTLIAPVPAASQQAWAETLKRKYTPEPAQSASAASKRPEPSLDQL